MHRIVGYHCEWTREGDRDSLRMDAKEWFGKEQSHAHPNYMVDKYTTPTTNAR